MGTAHSQVEGPNEGLSLTQNSTGSRSRKTYGILACSTDDTWVSAKVAPTAQNKVERDPKVFKVSANGGAFVGGMQPMEFRDVVQDYEKFTDITLQRMPVEDRRAQQMLITKLGPDYYMVPAPETFSRHSGICRILGDKNTSCVDYPLQVGDFIRIGSVGLVVSEINTGPEGKHQLLNEKDLLHLRNDAQEIRSGLYSRDEAVTASEELSSSPSGRIHVPVQCYMCFDDSNTHEDPLVAPCQCRGGTRYVHLLCLQRWQGSSTDSKVSVATSSTDKNCCKVCRTRYKTHVKIHDGTLLPLMIHPLPAPYICLLVVTRHESATELFNAQYQIGLGENRKVIIGRSRQCDMVLDYRTVSTQHASVTYKKGQFIFRDLSSSNGSMVHVRSPYKLPYGTTVRFRFGRSVVSLQAKKSWKRKLSSSRSQDPRRIQEEAVDVERGLELLTSLATMPLVRHNPSEEGYLDSTRGALCSPIPEIEESKEGPTRRHKLGRLFTADENAMDDTQTLRKAVPKSESVPISPLDMMHSLSLARANESHNFSELSP